MVFYGEVLTCFNLLDGLHARVVESLLSWIGLFQLVSGGWGLEVEEGNILDRIL
jgi:hypothetical protein